ncbi:hypothetical protein [Demequina sp. SO4-18]|uniref:hypothetical protein n=1 Tax=Demequina sp. SO4-18 TaxID=3401026 RepID=UPI003B5BE895
MTSIANPRRRAGQRISSALWGLLVAGMGVLLIASYSGYEIDLELAAIIVLAAIGGWLLLSAAVSGIGRKREISRATAPTVEERVGRTESADSSAAPAPADRAGAEPRESAEPGHAAEATERSDPGTASAAGEGPTDETADREAEADRDR